VAGDYRPLRTQSVDETHDVADVIEDRIRLDCLRTIASPIATQVGCHSTEPRIRQRLELMPPGIPALGKAVAEDDQRAFTLLGHVQADAVGLDHPVRHLGHRRAHQRCRPTTSVAWLLGRSLERLHQNGADGDRADRRKYAAARKCRALHYVAL
jgi:hypothetical protein